MDDLYCTTCMEHQEVTMTSIVGRDEMVLSMDCGHRLRVTLVGSEADVKEMVNYGLVSASEEGGGES